MGQNYIIMCRSLTYAQRASRQLERAGISAFITKAPQGVTASGCSYGVSIRERALNSSLAVIKSAGIKVGKVYRQEVAGAVVEVFL